MPALGLAFLPSVIDAFCRKYPGVNVSLEIQSSLRVEDWIAAQQTDIGLAELPYCRTFIAFMKECRDACFAYVAARARP